MKMHFEFIFMRRPNGSTMRADARRGYRHAVERMRI